jgi:glycosyltransferase involved in cell wall biosynthesis
MDHGRELGVWIPTIRAGTGADVFTQRLCDGLNARGVRAEITWLPHRAEYLPWAVTVPQPPAWASVVHVNSWLPRRFWPKGLPVVVTVHHLVHDPAFRPYRSVLQAVYHELLIRRRELHAIRNAVAVTTVSNYVRKTIAAFSGREDIVVIHNWVDCDKFRPDMDGPSPGDTSLRLFMAGSRSRRKGIDLLPDLAKALGPGFEIRCAGDHGGDVPTIEGIIELGRINEDALVSEYRTCDAVVSLSRYEGFGYTALEAMACGKPFYGFYTSALPEVVGQDCGVLVPIDSVHALADALRELRSRKASGEIEGGKGRNRVLARFSETNVDRYIETYLTWCTPKHTYRNELR